MIEKSMIRTKRNLSFWGEIVYRDSNKILLRISDGRIYIDIPNDEVTTIITSSNVSSICNNNSTTINYQFNYTNIEDSCFSIIIYENVVLLGQIIGLGKIANQDVVILKSSEKSNINYVIPINSIEKAIHINGACYSNIELKKYISGEVL